MAENERAVGKSYDGPIGVGRDSQWLTWEDLPEGKDLTATIEDVQLFQNVKFQGGRSKDRMLGLKFKGAARILGLNATNRKVLVKMFGGLTGGWKGQKIALHIAQTQMAGETVNCVRIRDRGSVAAKKASEFLDKEVLAGAADGDDFDQSVSALDLTTEEAKAALAEHGGDRAKAAAALSVKVNEKLAAEG